jgi:lysozyme
MKTSEAGLDFIRGFESYLTKQPDGSCRAYQCQAGRWTCGWGCTEGVTATTHWTYDEAKDHFDVEMAKHESAVNASVKVPITQPQFDALVSFSYNCGTGALVKLIGPLNAGDMRATASKFSEYCKYTDPDTRKKLVSRGLVRRRSEETCIFLKDEGGSMPQKVAVPDRKFSVKQALTKVAAPVGAVVAAAPSLPLPAVPDTITKSIETVEAWKGMGAQIWTLKAFALQQPVMCIAVGGALLTLWLWPKPKAVT